jgi:hypothetical protein
VCGGSQRTRFLLPSGCWLGLRALGGVYVTQLLAGSSQTYGGFAAVVGLFSRLLIVSEIILLASERYIPARTTRRLTTACRPVICGVHEAPDDEILEALGFGPERTFEQDPALALRVLADIALRALSPAVNDPTTAVQTLDAIDGLLRVLVRRDLAVEE